tara:strand:- start:78117 stop:79574 length:1458 start_codon:yes stop_codon:yes gene_type:complete
VGGKLMEKFSPKYKTMGTFFMNDRGTRPLKNAIHLDVTKSELTEKLILDFKPTCVIYAANYNVKKSLESPLDSQKVNLNSVKAVATLCSSLGIKFIYLSTDRVFEGSGDGSYSETTKMSPLSNFSENKVEAENFIRETVKDYIILRTSMPYGYSQQSEFRGHLKGIITNLSQGIACDLDNSTRRYPTLSDEIVEYIESLILNGEAGTYHISGPEGLTHFEIGKAVAKAYGFDTNLIKEKTSKSHIPSIELKSDDSRFLPRDISNFQQGLSVIRKQAGCAFKMIYSLRPDMLIADQNANDFRIKAGHKISEESPVPEDIDFVVPIPESGIYSATGVAAGSGKPIYFGIIRDYFTEKTLYSATLQNRYENLKRKLIPVREILEGKKIVLVDEAVLSGSTLKVVVSMLKDVGVREIHIRIPSPPMVNECSAKVLPNLKLAGKNMTNQKALEDQLQSDFNVDSFAFLSTKAFISIASSKEKMCFDCFLK